MKPARLALCQRHCAMDASELIRHVGLTAIAIAALAGRWPPPAGPGAPVPGPRPGWCCCPAAPAAARQSRWWVVAQQLLAIRGDPSAPQWYRYLAACCACMGRLDEAREIIGRLRTIA